MLVELVSQAEDPLEFDQPKDPHEIDKQEYPHEVDKPKPPRLSQAEWCKCMPCHASTTHTVLSVMKILTLITTYLPKTFMLFNLLIVRCLGNLHVNCNILQLKI